MKSDDRTGKGPEVGLDQNAKKIANGIDEAVKGSEEIQEIFWIYESGEVIIDLENLYDYLFKKGYRYFLIKSKDISIVVTVMDNELNVLTEHKLWKICSRIIDTEFQSVAEEVRIKVKAALKWTKNSLKKRQLVQLKPEDLESIQDSWSKQSLIRLHDKDNKEEGGAA